MDGEISLKCHSCQITTLIEVAEDSYEVTTDGLEFNYCPVCGSEIYEDEEFRMWIDDE